jgi:TadE-like protein
MKKFLTRMVNDQSASTAAEFGMVLPVAILFLFGTIDVGRMMWAVNRAEKATQMAVRLAVVTAPVPSGMAAYDFDGDAGLVDGDTVPVTAYGTMTCGTTTHVGAVTCTCVGSCPWGTAVDVGTPSFTAIYNRAKAFLPEVKRQNVKVDYSPSGLGYAGDPTGPDIAPVITVRLTGLSFNPLVLFGGSFTAPASQASLTMEDAVGLASN